MRYLTRYGNPRKPRHIATPEEKAAKAAAKECATKVFETLRPATEIYRQEYIKRYEDMRVEILVHMRETLAKNGMDLNKVAPYPKSNVGRSAYQIAKEMHSNYLSSFETVKPDRTDNAVVQYYTDSGRLSGKQPWIVKERENAEAKIREQARREAITNFDSFLFKMGEKIGKLITSAEMGGHLWDGCWIKVVCTDGEVQTWNTQCIINRSIYNKLFNQWPTRRAE